MPAFLLMAYAKLKPMYEKLRSAPERTRGEGGGGEPPRDFYRAEMAWKASQQKLVSALRNALCMTLTWTVTRGSKFHDLSVPLGKLM